MQEQKRQNFGETYSDVSKTSLYASQKRRYMFPHIFLDSTMVFFNNYSDVL